VDAQLHADLGDVASRGVGLPLAFTSSGLAGGMQVIGRYRDEFGVLQLAHALGAANPLASRKPPLLAAPLSAA